MFDIGKCVIDVPQDQRSTTSHCCWFLAPRDGCAAWGEMSSKPVDGSNHDCENNAAIAGSNKLGKTPCAMVVTDWQAGERS